MSSKTGAVYWMDLTFFTFICCNNCNFYLKRPKINEKEAGDGPCFFKKTVNLNYCCERSFENSLHFRRHFLRKPAVTKPFEVYSCLAFKFRSVWNVFGPSSIVDMTCPCSSKWNTFNLFNSLFFLLISLSCLNTFLSSFLSLSLSLLLHILSSSLNIWITLYFQVMCIRYSILLTHCGLPTLCYILYLSVNPIDVSFFVLHFCLYYLGI